MWHQFIGEQGNEPGPHNGKVTITLMNPVDGIGELTVPSAEVSVAAEGGSFIGLLVSIPAEGGPRRLFVSGSNVAGNIDTAVKKADSGDDGKPGSSRSGSSRGKAASE